MSKQPQPQVPRRHFLTGVGGATAAAALGGTGLWTASTGSAAAAPLTAAGGDAFDAVRATWQTLLTGGDFDVSDPDLAAAVASLDEKTTNFLSLIDRTPERTKVFTDKPLHPADESDGAAAGVRMRQTYERLRAIAITYRHNGSRYKGDPAVLADVLAGLETGYQQVYNPEQEQFGNWFDWRVAVPRQLNDTLALVYDQLPPDALDRYTSTIYHWVPNAGTNTATNLVWASDIIVRSGILRRDETRVLLGRESINPVFRYSPLYDTVPVTYSGWYPDGSFLQHAVTPYNGGYGMSFMNEFIVALEVLAGSPWAFSGDQLDFVLGQAERGLIPLVFNGEMMDSVRGRYLSRRTQTSFGAGNGVLNHILRLATTTDSETAARWRAICKGWLERNTDYPLGSGAPVDRLVRLKELAADTSVQPAPEPVAHKLYPSMERAVHRRPGWAYTIAMCSARTVYYETNNAENFHGYHTNAGMTYLYNDDAGQYMDDFWPTVHPDRMPGITVEIDSFTYGEKASSPPNTWAGGAVVDGEFAAIGMDSYGIGSTMRAKKSWFCLDEFVLALGAGIRGGSNPVHTYVENRNLHADGVNALVVNGRTQHVEQGWHKKLSGVRWAHLDGVAGYVFPDRAHLHALREERTGAWADIGRLPQFSGTPDPITRRYLTLWLDHGAEPDNDTYAYLVAPGATPSRTAELAHTLGGAEILANTDYVQAVSVPRLGLTMANFFAPGTVGGITTSQACSVILREGDGKLTVAVAEPTQQRGSRWITLTLDREGYTEWESDGKIYFDSFSPAISFTAEMLPDETRGGTLTITFSR